MGGHAGSRTAMCMSAMSRPGPVVTRLRSAPYRRVSRGIDSLDQSSSPGQGWYTGPHPHRLCRYPLRVVGMIAAADRVSMAITWQWPKRGGCMPWVDWFTIGKYEPSLLNCHFPEGRHDYGRGLSICLARSRPLAGPVYPRPVGVLLKQNVVDDRGANVRYSSLPWQW